MQKLTTYANHTNTKVGDIVKLAYNWRFGGQDYNGTAVVLKITSKTMQVKTEKNEKITFYKTSRFYNEFFSGNYGDILYK